MNKQSIVRVATVLLGATLTMGTTVAFSSAADAASSSAKTAHSSTASSYAPARVKGGGDWP